MFSVKVSPLATVFGVVSTADHRKLPAVDESQTEISVTVSEVVIDQDGLVPVSAIAPPEAVANVAIERVVTADGELVPAEPGEPVWSLTYTPETEYAVPRRVLRRLLARPLDRPSAMIEKFPYYETKKR